MSGPAPSAPSSYPLTSWLLMRRPEKLPAQQAVQPQRQQQRAVCKWEKFSCVTLKSNYHLKLTDGVGVAYIAHRNIQIARLDIFSNDLPKGAKVGGGGAVQINLLLFSIGCLRFGLFGFGRFQTVALLIRFKLSRSRSFVSVLFEREKCWLLIIDTD